jgi:hypothetical protein
MMKVARKILLNLRPSAVEALLPLPAKLKIRGGVY